MLGLLATAMALGISAGVLAGGTIANLANVRVRWTPALFVSLAVGVIPLAVDIADDPRFALQLGSHIGLLVFFGANIVVAERRWVRVGFMVIAIGWALNVAAIAANGGMPVSLWAIREAGITDPFTPGEGSFFRVVAAGPSSLLRPLGDVIPLRALRQVISWGDIFIIGGIAVVTTAGMRVRPRHRVQHVIDIAEQPERASA